MHPILRNFLAVIAGWLGGSAINMGLVYIGGKVLPIEGVDSSDVEALAEVMPTLSLEYFIFPFLAHALGTLAGAFIAGSIAASHKMTMALTVGVIFLVGGILVNIMIGGPMWFAVVDILLAYIPMAWIGGNMALKRSAGN